MMQRLTKRSLLLTTVLTLTPMLYGADAVESAGVTSVPAASVVNSRASTEVRVPTQLKEDDKAKDVADLNPEVIVKLIQDEFDKNKALLTPQHTAKDQDVVVFLGNTGAGKSTLINYLAGKALRVDGSELVLSADEDPEAMIIGTNIFKSETLYPKSIDVSIPGRPPLRFFDLPGFNDTDGSVRNLVNAAFIRSVLLGARTVRFVIVLGEGQFTNDRGQSAISTLKGLNKLFELEGVKNQPLDSGLCVVTKENGLMAVIEEATKPLPLQVMRWRTSERIVPMHHASINVRNTAQHRATLLQKISELEPTKLINVNLNSLYPPKSISDLDRMYSRMFWSAYEKKKSTPKTTVSDYERQIQEWRQEGFWQLFEDVYFDAEYPSVRILRDISDESYRNARDVFIREHQADRQAYLQTLERMKKERIEAVEKETELRTEQTIAAIKAKQGIEGVVPFDFANHDVYQDGVCGGEVLARITPDKLEHEIAKNTFAKWIVRYYQTQLDQQIRAALESKISAMEQILAQEVKASNEALAKEQKLRESLQSKIDALNQSHSQEVKALRELHSQDQKTLASLQSKIDALNQSHAQEIKASNEALAKEQKLRESLQSQVDALKLSHESERIASREVQRQVSQNLSQHPVIIAMQRQLKDLIMDGSVPEIARGYIDIYRQFLKGKLVYKPNKDNDVGRKEFPIAALDNPLEGTFDIRGCGDSAERLQISTGFRTRVNPANKDKLEIWIVPQFVLQRDPRAKAFNDFLQKQEIHRSKPFAILLNLGGWTNPDWYEVAGVDGIVCALDEVGESVVFPARNMPARPHTGRGAQVWMHSHAATWDEQQQLMHWSGWPMLSLPNRHPKLVGLNVRFIFTIE